MEQNLHSFRARVFDLVDHQALSSLGLVENQLLGPIGAVTLDGLKSNAQRLGYSHCSYRDPLRPGLTWVEDLRSGDRAPWKEFDAARMVDKVLPGILDQWEKAQSDPLDWEMVYPSMSTPSIQYCIALEWLVRKFPDAVVAWVELALTYENDLKATYAIESLFQQCRATSSHWRIVGHVLGLEARA